MGLKNLFVMAVLFLVVSCDPPKADDGESPGEELLVLGPACPLEPCRNAETGDCECRQDKPECAEYCMPQRLVSFARINRGGTICQPLAACIESIAVLDQLIIHFSSPQLVSASVITLPDRQIVLQGGFEFNESKNHYEIGFSGGGDFLLGKNLGIELKQKTKIDGQEFEQVLTSEGFTLKQ